MIINEFNAIQILQEEFLKALEQFIPFKVLVSSPSESAVLHVFHTKNTTRCFETKDLLGP